MSEENVEKDGTCVTIPVVTHIVDCGDGSHTVNIYNDTDELLADFNEPNMSEERKNDILCENDPYRNGYIGESTIKIIVMNDGSVRLRKPFFFNAG